MCAEVSLQVWTLEIRLLAAGEVTHVISPAGEVGLRGPAGCSWRHVNRGWGQGQQLCVAQSHDGLRALWWMGHRRLGDHKHHGPLRHCRAHQQRLSKTGRRLGQDGLWPPLSLHLNGSLDEGGDHPRPAAHWKHLAEHGGGGDWRGRGRRGRRQGGVRKRRRGRRRGRAAGRRRSHLLLWKCFWRWCGGFCRLGGGGRRWGNAEAVGGVPDDAGDHGSASCSHTEGLSLRWKCRSLWGERGGFGEAGVGVAVEGEPWTPGKNWSGGGTQSGGGGEDCGGGGLSKARTMRWSHTLRGRQQRTLLTWRQTRADCRSKRCCVFLPVRTERSGLWECPLPLGGAGWSHRSRRWGSAGGVCSNFDPRSSCWRAPPQPPGRCTRCTASAPWPLPPGRPYSQPEAHPEVKGELEPSYPQHKAVWSFLTKVTANTIFIEMSLVCCLDKTEGATATQQHLKWRKI